MSERQVRPLVVVLLGTDHHRFDRLVGWVAELAREDEFRWFVQHGRTPLPDSLEGRPMLSAGALTSLLQEASAVVTHGGPGLMMDARAAGHCPVVVPRDPALGEHVDGHQLLFTARMVRIGDVRTATSAQELRGVLHEEVAARQASASATDAHLQSHHSVRASQRFGELVAELCPPPVAARPTVRRVRQPAAQSTTPAAAPPVPSVPKQVTIAQGPGAPSSGPDTPPLLRQRGGAVAPPSGSAPSGPPPSGLLPPTPAPSGPAPGSGSVHAPLSRRAAGLRGAVARPRPVTMLTAELTGACLAVAALGAPVPLLVVWAVAMVVVHATGARFAERQPLAHGLQVGVTALALTGVAALLLESSPDRVMTMSALGAMTATTAAVRGARLLADRYAGSAAPRVVLVGASAHLPGIVHDLQRRGGVQVDIVGACLTDADQPTPDVTEALPPSVPVTTGLASVLPSVKVMDADAVIAMPWSGMESIELRRLEWQLAREGKDLWVAPGLVDTDPRRTDVLAAGAARLLRVHPSSVFGTRRLMKEALDRGLAATALLLLAPLLLLLMLLIHLDGSGPTLFRQRRIGRDGKPFTMLKLRTMVPEAEDRLEELILLNEADGALFKLRRDPRVTRVGAVLRRYSLDELPQLWNVVRGEMSLVGPRPPLPREVATYSEDTHRRLAVKPGLTGLWQVSGRSTLSWDETQRLDLKYVDNWSLRLDLSILLRTFRAVVSRQGAF